MEFTEWCVECPMGLYWNGGCGSHNEGCQCDMLDLINRDIENDNVVEE